MNNNPFQALSVGVNPRRLSQLLSKWKETADADQLLAMRDLGIDHWPYLSAMNGGVLDLTVRQNTEKEDRTYTVAPFPVQSIPKGSPLREAFTSPYEGEVLVDLDWSASHWQILAFRSNDAQLQADLRSGDLYTTQFPGVARKAAKTGLNTVLNGGGWEALVEFFTEPEAKAFIDRARDLLKTRWPKANSELFDLRDEAVSQGWVTEERKYAGSGVALMRLEADMLREAVSVPRLAEAGVRVVLPLHDGILVSVPADKADKLAVAVAKVMVLKSTGSVDEATNHLDTWVKYEVKQTWGGDGEQLVGRALRAEALKAVTNHGDPHGLTLAVCAMKSETDRARKAHHPSSVEGRAYKSAITARGDAVSWKTDSAIRHDPNAVPPIDLPHGIPNYTNICRIVGLDTTLPALQFNARESTAYIGGDEANDTLIRRTYFTALEERYGMLRVGEQTLMSAVFDVAREREFDPVLDYFEGLKWDGVERLACWLEDHCNAQELSDSPTGRDLVKVYGSKWLVSIVARAYEPGCKVDTMLVIMGAQGAQKSTLLRTIAPCGSYAPVQIDPSDKDSVLRASRFAIVEWPELAGASKREQEALKDYFSLNEDRVRPPYAKGDLRIPRRTVFAATTNEDDFLRDPTGSRRYWPIKVGNIDIDAIKEHKDQLWAEAVDLYKYLTAEGKDHKWWLNEAQDAERNRQAYHFTADDPFASAVWECLRDHSGAVTVDEVLEHLDVKPSDRPRVIRGIRATLKKFNCKSKSVREDGRVTRKWVCDVPARKVDRGNKLDNIIDFAEL
jgi:hypothetical protein